VKRLAVVAPLIALLASAAPALGAGSITPVRVNVAPSDWYGGIGGPVSARDAIVWGRAVSEGYQVLVQRGDRAERRTIRFDGIRHVRQYVARLAASSRRFGLDLEVTACPGERGCEGGAYGTKRIGLETNFHALCEDGEGVAHTEVAIFDRRRPEAPRNGRVPWRHHVVTVHGVRRDLPRCST
jgi:hypothetical protein